MFEKKFLGFLVGSLFLFAFFSVSFSNFQLIDSKIYDRVCDRFEVDEDKIYYSGAFLRGKSNIDFCSQFVRSNVNREAVKMNRFCLYGPDMNSCSYVGHSWDIATVGGFSFIILNRYLSGNFASNFLANRFLFQGNRYWSQRKHFTKLNVFDFVNGNLLHSNSEIVYFPKLFYPRDGNVNYQTKYTYEFGSGFIHINKVSSVHGFDVVSRYFGTTGLVTTKYEDLDPFLYAVNAPMSDYDTSANIVDLYVLNRSNCRLLVRGYNNICYTESGFNFSFHNPQGAHRPLSTDFFPLSGGVLVSDFPYSFYIPSDSNSSSDILFLSGFSCVYGSEVYLYSLSGLVASGYQGFSCGDFPSEIIASKLSGDKVYVDTFYLDSVSDTYTFADLNDLIGGGGQDGDGQGGGGGGQSSGGGQGGGGGYEGSVGFVDFGGSCPVEDTSDFSNMCIGGWNFLGFEVPKYCPLQNFSCLVSLFVDFYSNPKIEILDFDFDLTGNNIVADAIPSKSSSLPLGDVLILLLLFFGFYLYSSGGGGGEDGGNGKTKIIYIRKK